MFITQLWKYPADYLQWVTIVMFSICVHEASHAWAAATQGDRTACDNGYCTLNPLKVMGPQSLLMLAICGIAWGAVPVNPAAMRRPHSRAVVSGAGPGANLVLAIIFALLSAAMDTAEAVPVTESFSGLFQVGIRANCMLLILNTLPIPMLDGWQLYSWVFPGLRRVDAEKQAGLSLFLLVVLFMSPAGAYVWLWANWLALILDFGAGRLLGS